MLTVSNLSKRFGDRLVLDRVSFIINPGDRIGLLGPNGAGKSTLLAIIAGAEASDGGVVTLRPAARVGHLRQGFAELPGTTLGGLVARVSKRTGALLAAHDHLDAATRALADATIAPEPAMAACAEALADLEARGGYAAFDELASLLAALGLDGVPLDAPLPTLSGGQKTRAGLASLLADQPDLLLLDEPTNHLDLDALAWLEGFLAAYRGAVLVVSHDRAFLDRTVTSILELDDVSRRVTAYSGGYSDYLAAKGAAAAAHAAAYER